MRFARPRLAACAALAAGLVVLGCAEADPPPPADGRGRDPWVFRSVLDGRPRMVTLALHPELWVAYDTSAGALHRAWRGDVRFDGPVYTEVHGPQPTSEGLVLQAGGDPEPWSLRDATGPHDVTVRYRGHRFENGRVRLRYALELPGGSAVTIDESPEQTGSAEAPDLERRFRVSGVPPGSEIVLALPRPGAHLAYETDGGTLELDEGGAVLVLGAEGETRLIARYDDAAVAQPSTAPAITPDEALAERHARQLQQHGCQSCHARDARTTGPALVEIAQRYPWTASVRDRLAWRVATGGSGVFGDVAMPAHPELDDETRASLVDIILALDGEPAPGPDGSQLGLGQRLERRLTRFFMRAIASLRTLRWNVLVPLGETPGDGVRLTGVHPSFDLEQARPAGFAPRVGGLAFFPDGRLAVCTWDEEGAVYLLENPEAADPESIRVRKIASGLAEPLGLAVVDGALYVLQKQELTRLVDHDGDGTIDEYRTVSADWTVSANFHEFAFGLAHAGGELYATLATAVLPGGKASPSQPADRGSLVAFSLETGAMRRVAHGLRTPNGVGVGPRGALYVTDNQGDWLPSSKILRVEEGAFYGSRAVAPERTRDLPATPPLAWLPQDEIGNSPSQPLAFTLGPYRDQLLVGDVTHGGVKRVFVEEIDGVGQGTVFRFTQGLEAGVNRLAWGPDGKLYAGGIGNPGNWSAPGQRWDGLQRLAYNGRPTFEILAVRTLEDGLEVELTQSVRDASGLRPEDFALQDWRYQPTSEYGGPKLDVRSLRVESVELDAQDRRARLRVPELEAGRVVYLRLRRKAFANEAGDALWSTEAWKTLNRKPGARARQVVEEDRAS